MKFSLWTNNGALNSRPVFDAFAHSCVQLGHDIVYNDPSADIDVIWSVLWHGRMAPNKEIWDKAKAAGKNIIVLEVGGLNRGITWKVGLNGINRDAYFGGLHNNSSRADALGLLLKPWRNNENGPIVIACQHSASEQWRQQKRPGTWVFEAIQEIRKHTEKEVIIRPHPRCRIDGIQHEFNNVRIQEPMKIPGTYDDFDFKIEDAYAVVNWSSNPATHAILEGIPVFVGPSSLAYEVGNPDYTTINNPLKPDRTQWLNDIAHTEWTIDEISAGLPLKRLTSEL